MFVEVSNTQILAHILDRMNVEYENIVCETGKYFLRN